MKRLLIFGGIGCGGLLVLLVVVIIIGAAIGQGGSDQASSSGSSGSSGQSSSSSGSGEKTVSIGEAAMAGDVTWTITNASQANQLTAAFGNPKQGNFVIVDFGFQNNSDKAVTLDTNSLSLKDSNGRESKADPDVFQYVDPNKQIFLKQVNPGVTQQGEAIYTVAPDASGFVLVAGDTNPFGGKEAYVDLGF